MAADASSDGSGQPSRVSLLWLKTRITILRLRRGAVDRIQRVPRWSAAPANDTPFRIAHHRSGLYQVGTQDRQLELGKVQNLRVAGQCLNGLYIPAGGLFSFWAHVGRCTKRKRYVPGRQLQEGCFVPDIGGGICQLSNALYDVALQAGFEIVERHPHTRIVPGSAAELDRDATVAWNHIDLRFRPAQSIRLSVNLTSHDLEVSIWSDGPVVGDPKRPRKLLRQSLDVEKHSCGICERTDCVLYTRGAQKQGEKVAYLVDEYWPEFDGFLQANRTHADDLFLPLKGHSAYPWTQEGFGSVRDGRFATLRRSLRSRRNGSQGAARQAARLRSLSELARCYASQLSPSVTHLVVTLDLVPFLWDLGVLGGRTFDVLMTRHPMAELQGRLDRAFDLNQDRAQLVDFRAPKALIESEREALRVARRIIAVNASVMPLDRRRVQLSWLLPPPLPWIPGEVLVFPGPVVARKGAYEVRESATQLGAPVRVIGRQLLGEQFWTGVRLLPNEGNWLEGALAVVQPAVLEDKPRRLLQAIASGCPVIVTEACGLPPGPLVHVVPEGDSRAVIEVLEKLSRTSQALTR